MAAMCCMRCAGAELFILWISGGCQQSSEVRPAAASSAKRPEASSRAEKVAAEAAQSLRPKSAESQTSSAAEAPTESGTTRQAPQPASARSAAGKAPPADEIGQVDPADLVMPKVLLTDAHAKTCLVRMGESMPAITLADLAGKQQSLAHADGQGADGRAVLDRQQSLRGGGAGRSGARSAPAVRSAGIGSGGDRRGGCPSPGAPNRAEGGGPFSRIAGRPGRRPWRKWPAASCRGPICSTPRARSCGSTSNTPAAPGGICATPSNMCSPKADRLALSGNRPIEQRSPAERRLTSAQLR